jgi:hypothetical protein
MVAAIVLDIWRLRILRLKHCVPRRAMFPKKRADFFAFGRESKLSFTLCPAMLA